MPPSAATPATNSTADARAIGGASFVGNEPSHTATPSIAER